MKKFWLLGVLSTCLFISVGVSLYYVTQATPVSEAVSGSYSSHEPEFDPEPHGNLLSDIAIGAPAKYTINELQNWEKPAGPQKVGIQVGHWQNESMPEELENLERNTGATWGGMTEASVVLVISQLIQQRLQAEGIEAELLPATVPPGYVADVFLSIHADGNVDSGINGFKFAAPRR